MTRDVRAGRCLVYRISERRVVWCAALLAVVVVAPAHGQMALGVTGGINRGTADVSVGGTAAEVGTRDGWNAGAMLYVGLGSWLGIQGGAFYTQKGPGSVLVDTTLTRIDLYYVDIPLMAVAMFPSTGMFKVRGLAGPSLNLKVGCGSAAEGEPILDCDQDAVKNYEFSVLFGAGLKIGKGVGGLTLDVLYDYGLTNVNNTNAPINFKTRTLMFNVGFLLQFPDLTAPQFRQ